MKFTPRLVDSARLPSLMRAVDACTLLFVSLLIAVFSSAVMAQAAPESDDPPGRVARLSELEGQVWLYSQDTGEWVSAVRNQPITTGDRVATDAGARAEVELGSTTLRIDASTEFEVVQLDDERFATQLHNGSVAARVRDVAGAGQFELTTDEGRFVVDRAGSYRFDRTDGASWATVYSGQARYEGPNSALPVTAGQRAEFWIDSGGVAQYSLSAPVRDAFAAWSVERDRVVVGSIATRYVSPEMTGAGELDRYGRWEQSPDYGPLWIPANVAADWAPYSNGHWAWVRPWGWTWIDDAPWGFAPFHYGRWVYARNTWCWTPGTRVARPIYAPALVAWVGGPRSEVGISIGGRGGPAVGWFPLAPREVYVPGYRGSPRYVRNLNITNVTNVTQITTVINNPQAPREFGNRRFPHAITVVPAGVMTARQPVGPAAAQFRQTPWVREIANQPGRATAMLSPPVSAPAVPARAAERREVRPPPGAAPDAGRRPAGEAGPRFPQRDREGERREGGGRPDGARPTPPVAQQPAPARPVEGPLNAAGPTRPMTPPAAEQPNRRPGFDRGEPRPDQRGEPRQDDRRRGGNRAEIAAPPTASPNVAPAAAPPVAATPAPVARPAPAQTAQEGPTMRAHPVQRGEERERRSEERRGPTPRSTEPQGAENRGAQQPRPERPAVVQAPAPVIVPRPVEAPRPVEVQRAAPAPAPVVAPAAPPVEVRRPEPRQRGEEPRSGQEQRRDAVRDRGDPQK